MPKTAYRMRKFAISCTSIGKFACIFNDFISLYYTSDQLNAEHPFWFYTPLHSCIAAYGPITSSALQYSVPKSNTKRRAVERTTLTAAKQSMASRALPYSVVHWKNSLYNKNSVYLRTKAESIQHFQWRFLKFVKHILTCVSIYSFKWYGSHYGPILLVSQRKSLQIFQQNHVRWTSNSVYKRKNFLNAKMGYVSVPKIKFSAYVFIGM